MKTKSALRFSLPSSPRLRGIFLSAVLALAASSASAQTITSSVPGLISFQGRVTTPAGALVGDPTPVNRIVTLRIWSSPSSALASDLIYSEQQTATISLGEFSVLIGQGTNVTGEETKGPGTVALGSLGVFAGATRYLGITVDDGTAAADPEISPRQQIVTSAYAFRAKFAESIGTNGTSALTVVDGGNVGVGFPNPGFKLEVNGNVSAAGSIAATGTSGFIFRTGDTDGGLFSPADDTVVIKTNNANRVTVTSGGLTLNSGTMFAPSYSFTSPGDTDGGISSPSDGVMTFLTNASERMRLDPSGRLGLGTATAAFTFDVRSATPEILVGTSGGLLGALYFGGTGYGVKRNYNGVANDVGLYATTGDVYLSANGAARTTDFVLKNAGQVAIGTATVADKLNVGGNIRLTGVSSPALVLADAANTVRGMLGAATANGQFSSDAAVNDTILRSEGSKLVLQSGSGASALAITSTNLVGVGTSAPEAKLDIAGNTNDAIQAILTRGGDANFRLAAQNKSSSNAVGAEVSRFGLAYGTTIYTGFSFTRGGSGSDSSMALLAGGSERVRFTSGGDVGIGTSSPAAKLEVNGGTSISGIVGGYLNINGASASTTHGAHSVSIKTSGTIWCGNTFIASSDERIKSVLGRSDGVQDLQILRGIEITDYRYRDTIANGDGAQKKVIAQQVEKIFPQAVTRRANVVPDIYQKAALSGGWVELATNLKKGERVRLLGGAEEGVHEVLETKAGAFRTAFSPAVDTVFVYGREVSDFRSVDYDAIAMLNVSATQQIKRDTDTEVASLRAENAALRAQLATQDRRLGELETKNTSRDAKLAAIEKMLSTATTVMARPATSSTAGGQ